MQNKISTSLLLLLLASATGCEYLPDLVDVDEPKPQKPQVTPFATGLTAPLGIESGTKGQIWVTEAGSGLANDGYPFPAEKAAIYEVDLNGTVSVYQSG